MRAALPACLLLLAAGGVAAQERLARVVPERAARVFVMAGFDAACRALAPVAITIDRPPAQGAISFRDQQQTTIQSSGSGSCIGARITGTGIYYTARAGARGTDSFSVTARLGSETATRTFTVVIAED